MKILASGNPNVMLIGHERVFYNGLLGNSGRHRALGAFAVYASPFGTFGLSVGGGPQQQLRIAAVPTFVPHRLTSDCDLISTLLIEPETVAEGELRLLAQRIATPSGAAEAVSRIEAAKTRLETGRDCRGFTSRDFDELLLGRAQARRPLDARVGRTVDRLRQSLPGSTVTADECAAEAQLSRSRYLHLFSRETGTRFRSYRMWKRARGLLPHVNGCRSLTDLALDLGYPDSTHFSHSIRRIYGLTPRSIFKGSRDLRIVPGEDYPAA